MSSADTDADTCARSIEQPLPLLSSISLAVRTRADTLSSTLAAGVSGGCDSDELRFAGIIGGGMGVMGDSAGRPMACDEGVESGVATAGLTEPSAQPAASRRIRAQSTATMITERERVVGLQPTRADTRVHALQPCCHNWT